MNELRISLSEDRTEFEPGEEIAGMVHWNLDQPPESVELRLFWFTRGKGTDDAGIVDTVRFDHPPAQATKPFRFTLPEGPYSFSGKLISLIWSLELVVQPTKQVQSLELVVAPEGSEVCLEAVIDTEVKNRFSWKQR